MNIDLGGSVIVVTGAAQGIGAEIAAKAAGAGAGGLLLTDRNGELGRRTASRLAAPSCRVEFVEADLEDVAGARLVIAEALSRFGRIDGLVNAAGITDRASVLDGTPELWDRLFAVNARAPYFLMQGAIADMARRKAPGAIVNIASMNAHCGAPDLAIYSATKAALVTLTRNAANAHLADRIRVNAINVGWTLTPTEIVMQTDILGHSREWLEDVVRRQPLGRMLEPEEVARLALYLLSGASGLMTGVVLDLEQKVLGAP
ncbi:MAG: SDR family oxidoreductase [Rhodobacteraceae bacterium]|nr:SDR family oxidoreductase [Paracoccaceae bacterium]